MRVRFLRFNDEACSSLIYNHLQGSLIIGATDDTADSILPFLLSRFTSLYPKLEIDVRVKRSPDMRQLLKDREIDLAVTTMGFDEFSYETLRRSPTVWFCATDYDFQPSEPVPLVVLDEPSPFRALAIKHLNEAGIPWRIAYVASTLSAVRAAVKAGLGVTARPIEMMSPELRVLGLSERLPKLPETEYALCLAPNCTNELATILFSSLKAGSDPYIEGGPGVTVQTVQEGSFSSGPEDVA